MFSRRIPIIALLFLCTSCMVNLGSRTHNANGNGFGGTFEAKVAVTDSLNRLKALSARFKQGQGIDHACDYTRCGNGDNACATLRDMPNARRQSLIDDLVSDGRLNAVDSILQTATFAVTDDSNVTGGTSVILKNGQYVWLASTVQSLAPDDIAASWLEQALISAGGLAHDEASCLVASANALEDALAHPSDQTYFDLSFAAAEPPHTGGWENADFTGTIVWFNGLVDTSRFCTRRFDLVDGEFQADVNFQGGTTNQNFAIDVRASSSSRMLMLYLSHAPNATTLSYSIKITHGTTTTLAQSSGTLPVDFAHDSNLQVSLRLQGAGIQATVGGQTTPVLLTDHFDAGAACAAGTGIHLDHFHGENPGYR